EQACRARVPGRGIDRERDRPDPAADEIGEEVAALVLGAEAGAAVHVAAGNRGADAVVVLEDRIDERREGRRPRRDVVVRALAVAPAVILSAPAARFVVDL